MWKPESRFLSQKFLNPIATRPGGILTTTLEGQKKRNNSMTTMWWPPAARRVQCRAVKAPPSPPLQCWADPAIIIQLPLGTKKNQLHFSYSTWMQRERSSTLKWGEGGLPSKIDIEHAELLVVPTWWSLSFAFVFVPRGPRFQLNITLILGLCSDLAEIYIERLVKIIWTSSKGPSWFLTFPAIYMAPAPNMAGFSNFCQKIKAICPF